MDVTSSFSIVLISMVGFIGIILLVDLVLDYRWSRAAQHMHAKGPKEK